MQDDPSLEVDPIIHMFFFCWAGSGNLDLVERMEEEMCAGENPRTMLCVSSATGADSVVWDGGMLCGCGALVGDEV